MGLGREKGEAVGWDEGVVGGLMGAWGDGGHGKGKYNTVWIA